MFRYVNIDMLGIQYPKGTAAAAARTAAAGTAADTAAAAEIAVAAGAALSVVSRVLLL